MQGMLNNGRAKKGNIPRDQQKPPREAYYLLNLLLAVIGVGMARYCRGVLGQDAWCHQNDATERSASPPPRPSAPASCDASRTRPAVYGSQ